MIPFLLFQDHSAQGRLQFEAEIKNSYRRTQKLKHRLIHCSESVKSDIRKSCYASRYDELQKKLEIVYLAWNRRRSFRTAQALYSSMLGSGEAIDKIDWRCLGIILVDHSGVPVDGCLGPTTHTLCESLQHLKMSPAEF